MDRSFLDFPTPFGMAHRGGGNSAPENTVGAFSHAVDLGYRYLETDVLPTADGVLVAFHDDDLERVTGLQGRISDYRWAELSEVRIEGIHGIPRLDALFELFPDARFNVDPKADDAVDLLVEVIRANDAVDRVCIGSFSEDRVKRARAAFGSRLCTSPGPLGLVQTFTAALLWPRWQPPYGCVQMPTRRYGVPLTGRWLIRRLQRLGLQVHYWTINTEAEMIDLLDRGADAIITDETELLKRVLEDRGQWVASSGDQPRESP